MKYRIYIIYIYHAKSRLNTPVWGSLRSPNYIVVGMSVVCQINCVEVELRAAHAHAQSIYFFGG